MAVKGLSIRIDDELLHKLHIVASYEGRSANGEVLVLIRDAVEAYEAKHGSIDLSAPPKPKSKESKKRKKSEESGESKESEKSKKSPE